LDDINIKNGSCVESTGEPEYQLPKEELQREQNRGRQVIP